MSFTTCSAGSLAGLDFCLIFAPSKGYDEPEILPSSSRQICLIGADAGHPKTLRKHYRGELDHGHVKANAKVAENLYRKATGDGRESVIAAIFWLKTRAGWRENNELSFSATLSAELPALSPEEWERACLRAEDLASSLPPPRLPAPEYRKT